MALNGVEKLMRQFNQLGSMDPIVKKAVRKQAEVVRAVAVELCPHNHGELRGSIHTKVEQDGDATIGTVYTNKEYAAYVEFGTGPKGQASHEGISPKVNVVYRQSEWWFPGDAVDPADGDKYHWPKGEKDGKVFYRTKGQPAHPFMYPALKTMERRVIGGLAADLQAGIQEVGG